MYDSIRIREMIDSHTKQSLEHTRNDLRHRDFTWDGQSEAIEDGQSERWTKPIGLWDSDGIWIVTVTARSLNGTKAIGHFAKVEMSVPEREGHKLYSVLDRLGHRWS